MIAMIQMYHNNPPTRYVSETGNVDLWCTELWGYQIEEAVLIAGGDEAVEQTFASMIDASLKEVQAAHPGYELPLGVTLGAAVYLLRGDRAQFRALAGKWATELIETMKSEHGISGDDSYFDYFPDYCEGLYQLCQQIDYPEPWNESKQTLEAPGAPYAPGDPPEDLLPGRL